MYYKTKMWLMMFLAALVFAVGLIAGLYFLYLHNRDTAPDSYRLTYEGEEPEWFECESFADIPQKQ